MSAPESSKNAAARASAAQSHDAPSPNTSIDALFPPIYLPGAAAATDRSQIPPSLRRRPYPDSRCFSWCSQDSHERLRGKDPLCRMICWNVDKEEGKKLHPDPQSIRRHIRRWIDERELSFFRGTLEEMRVVQDEKRELQREEEEFMKETRSSWWGEWSLDKDRAAVERLRRRKRDNLDWAVDVRNVGEKGILVQLPLSSLIVKPYYHFIHRLDVITGPSRRFFNAYVSSFTDGTQSRIAGLAWEKAKSGDVLEFGWRLSKKVAGVWMRPWQRPEDEEGPKRRDRSDE